MPRLIAFLMFTAVTCRNACGQCPETLTPGRATSIPVRVIGKNKQVVDNLRPENFAVTVGGVPQTICGVFHEQTPVSLGILFDTSGSMAGRQSDLLKITTSAIQQLLNSAVKTPNNEYLLQYVNEHPTPVEFTSDVSRIRAGLAAKAKGKTALLDAVYLALNAMQRARYIDRALLIVSDGLDNCSTHDLKDLERAFAEAPIPIFFVNPMEGWNSPLRGSPDEARARGELIQFVNNSGGYTIVTQGTEHITTEMAKLAQAIFSPYLVVIATSRADITPHTVLHVKIIGLSPAPAALFRAIQFGKANDGAPKN